VSISANPWHWIMGLAEIAVFSVVFRATKAYRFVEHLYVGASVGYALQMAFGNVVNQAWRPMVSDGKITMVIPIALGLMLYTRYFKSIAWVSRWPVAFLVGIGSGLSIYGSINAQFVAQTRATILDLFVTDSGGAFVLGQSLNNLITLVVVGCVLLYFVFSVKMPRGLNKAVGLGRWAMMITFGVFFGNVVQNRLSLLITELENILGSWLGLI
jgi:hypothetical protein